MCQSTQAIYSALYNTMKIVFSGGGTLGPVTPLLALKDVIQKAHPDAAFVWVGTTKGPEKKLVAEHDIPFFALPSGKFRRYISFWNIIDITKIFIGFFHSIVFLWHEDPDICISAGGFVSVPLHWAAWFLGIPTWIHQQDVQVGLANKLMTPMAWVVTTALQESVPFFPKKKTHWLGNPIRAEMTKGRVSRARKIFKLSSSLPVVFATGGGTGSLKVNQMIAQAAQHLDGVCQIIHLTGKERPQDMVEPMKRQFPMYKAYPFFTHEMKDAYAVASLVISRGGFGTITELAALRKPAILIPKPGHQEENVAFLEGAEAVVLLDERTTDGNHLAQSIKELLSNRKKMKDMGNRLHDVVPPADQRKALELFNSLTNSS